MKLSVFALATVVASVAATPVAPAAPRPAQHLSPMRPRQGTNSTEPPCARVSQAIYSQPSTSLTTQVPAKLAYDCLQSIPVNVSSAKTLLAEMPTYINWQSTLTALKNPPAEYAEKVQPPLDVLGGLQKISAALDAGEFTSEYDFGWALYTLIQSAHDGHFTYVPDTVSSFFTWGRRVPLVSVSEDGEKLPAIFAFQDVLGLQFKNISYTPSPVTQIDGVSATEFLENWSQFGSLQDRDALYNNVFYELAQVSLGSDGSGTGTFTGGGRGRFAYPGATTTLTFANGTSYTMENYANVWQTFRGIQTGEDLASKFLTYTASAASAASVASTKTIHTAAGDDNPQTPEMPGYPVPVVAGPAGIINGYYIEGSGHEDVAVLQINNFVNSDYYEEPFQQTSQQFFAKALADGKTKLIIDVQANGGGTILQGYDLFKQLFPSLDPYGANRWRYTEGADLIGQAYSAYIADAPRRESGNYTLTSAQVSSFDYHTDMTVDGKPFSSWEEKVGPHEVNGDEYTTLARWNLSDPLIHYFGGINITGYGPLSNVTGPAKFKPESIVLLTDGYCASTCSIFSEFMTKQGGVKTIALGGRSNRNKVQAVGGVKGVNSLSWSYIQAAAENARDLAPPSLKEKINSSVLATEYTKNLVFNRAATSPNLNVRDGVALNDDSGTALQFIYQEADCRLYYTPEMTVDATSVWKAAADAQWSNSGKCVDRDGSGSEKRSNDVFPTTTKLVANRLKIAQAAALQQYEAFERSFKLETVCNKERAGWMKP
ncbi:peptidase S41 family protein-like protein [Periconia macrospinosa]|uniref:Peptidase S41 family protein-like protein n=1 Tax=Periconia macrospinosa TaxID=97972 RepID=A0A2V1DLF7_9PLEO|nr:peptidase S41 family protein-like protein [Periconia macrospinosa]